jgi:outer membrane protein assembly factor BamB
MKMNELMISHWKGYGSAGPRYYNGVPSRRTTISCVAVLLFLGLVPFSNGVRAAITFPLSVKWTVALEAPPLHLPGFDDLHAYVALQNNRLVAVSLKDGKTVWSVDAQLSAAPAAGDGLVFVGGDGLIEARAQADGRAQWRRPVKGRIALLYWDTGWLVAATETGPIFALRATDGEILWQRDLDSPLSAPPAPAAERLYLALKDGRILALSLTTGDDIWMHKLTESAVGLLPVGNRVFVGARDNQFYSLDAENAKVDWRWRTGADIIGLPVLDERRVYFIALDNVLRGHDRNGGSMIWKQILPMRPFTGPLISGDTILVAGVAAAIHGYHARDGEPIDEFVLKGAENEEVLLAAPPHLTRDDMFILVTKGGSVRAIGAAVPGEKPAAHPAAPAPVAPATPPAAEPESTLPEP